MITTTNPYNQETLATYSFLSQEKLQKELNQIQKSFETWSTTSVDLRINLANNFKKLLLGRKENLAKLISLEMGKPILESIAEIEKSATLVTYFVDQLDDFLSPTPMNNKAYISYHPTGAVFGIMPWNFPFWQVFRYAIPNILAGNVCTLKHAPNVFGCAKEIEQLFLDAGFPKNVFTNLIIDLSQVETVIAHTTVQGVCVTGSARAGSSVASLAGKHLKKTVLELGGTDAFAILKDADITTALNQAFVSRFKNGGQVCIAAKRIFIPENELDFATKVLSKKLQNLTLGNPIDTTTSIGPIAKPEFLPILQKQVEACISNGAELIVGGQANPPFYEPTLLVVNADNPLLKEELFGPIICLITYENEKKLVKEINNSDYGLGAAVWSKDLKRAQKIAHQIQAGHVAINSLVVSDPKIPFGGIKKSGYGKELGKDGFRTFLNSKTIVISN